MPPHLGVCNGTRVRVFNIGRRLLHVVILTGPKRGHEVSLPRICCDAAEDTDLPFALRRYQFPVRRAWAMTNGEEVCKLNPKQRSAHFSARKALPWAVLPLACCSCKYCATVHSLGPQDGSSMAPKWIQDAVRTREDRQDTPR